MPLLKDANAAWPDRYLFIHVGRWLKGKAAESKYAQCAVRFRRFRLVNNQELYDIQADPGETKNVAEEHADVVAAMRAAYDEWWEEVLPALENEDVVGPKVNPFKERYWRQFGGGPKDLKALNRSLSNGRGGSGTRRSGVRGLLEPGAAADLLAAVVSGKIMAHLGGPVC